MAVTLEAAAGRHGGEGNATANACGPVVALVAPPIDGGAAIAVVVAAVAIGPTAPTASPQIDGGAGGLAVATVAVAIAIALDVAASAETRTPGYGVSVAALPDDGGAGGLPCAAPGPIDAVAVAVALEAAAGWHGGAGNAMARVCGVAVALAAPPVDGGAAIAVVLTIFPITAPV